MPAHRRPVNTVFQSYALFPHMTVQENVVYGLMVKKVPKAERRQRATDALAMARLEGYGDRKPAQLSGGQRQRVALARALAQEADILLMDEPCSALDPISTLAIEDLIAELKDDYTIVIVTHNMQQAQRVSRKCAFFLVEQQGQSGRIVEAGDTSMMFSNPSDQRTLDYVSGRFG